jgi:ribosomal protein S18 acetylase RimI-like enzyme
LTDHYYVWNSERDKFVKSVELPKNRVFHVVYRTAINRDKDAILKFEIECEKTEPEVYISEYDDLQKKLPSIDFDKRKDFEIVLASVDNKIVGLLSMSWYFDYERNCRVGVIPGLWVLKPYRVAGIGKGLMLFAREMCKKLNVQRIELVVGVKNLAAQEFYKKLGFKNMKVNQLVLDNL